jgi:hypothetical protein
MPTSSTTTGSISMRSSAGWLVVDRLYDYVVVGELVGELVERRRGLTAESRVDHRTALVRDPRMAVV